MKQLIAGILALLVLSAFYSCTQDELTTFKNTYDAADNAFRGFSQTLTAAANAGKLGSTTAADVARFSADLDALKPLLDSITVFPPANSQQLRNLLAQTMNQVSVFIANAGGNITLVAALAAVQAFLQTTQDMLPDGASPAIAPRTGSGSATATNADLKARLKDMQEKIKAVKL